MLVREVMLLGFTMRWDSYFYARPHVSARHGADRGCRASPQAASSSGATGDPMTGDLVNEPVLEAAHAITTDSSLDNPKCVSTEGLDHTRVLRLSFVEDIVRQFSSKTLSDIDQLRPR